MRWVTGHVDRERHDSIEVVLWPQALFWYIPAPPPVCAPMLEKLSEDLRGGVGAITECMLRENDVEEEQHK